MDRIVEVKLTTCMLDPCPLQLVQEVRGNLKQWCTLLTNSLLPMGVLPSRLKEATIRLKLKKPSLDPAELGSFRPVSNLPFGGRVVKRVVAGQQQFLEDADSLDPSQSGF